MQRIQKIIAQKGFCSRRKAEQLIKTGHVKCNGKIITLGSLASEKDIIEIDDKLITYEKIEKKIYIILNKPRGYVTTLYDEKNRKKVTDLTSSIKQRIYPVGRLDLNSQGLLLLTNDGQLAAKIMHPSTEIIKTYIVTIKKNVTKKEKEIMEKGVFLNGKKTANCKIEILENSPKKSVLVFKIHEGKKRHIRRLVGKILHCDVIILKRIEIGPIKLGNLKIGKFRFLTKKEIDMLKNAINKN